MVNIVREFVKNLELYPDRIIYFFEMKTIHLMYNGVVKSKLKHLFCELDFKQILLL